MGNSSNITLEQAAKYKKRYKLSLNIYYLLLSIASGFASYKGLDQWYDHPSYMNREFELFFTLSATISATLWVVTVALLAIVLSNATIGNDLGILSTQMRNVLRIAKSSQISSELRDLVNFTFTQYRSLWFALEVLPIPIYFQVAMFLSLFVVIPGIPLVYLAYIPMVHMYAWFFLGFFSKTKSQQINQKLQNLLAKSSTHDESSNSILDQIKAKPENTKAMLMLGFRSHLWIFPLLLLYTTILMSPFTLSAIVGSVIFCIVVGVIRMLCVTANIIFSQE